MIFYLQTINMKQVCGGSGKCHKRENDHKQAENKTSRLFCYYPAFRYLCTLI